MKVLVVNTLYHPIRVGGAEISVQNLSEHLSMLGFDMGVLTLGQEDEFTEINGIPVWRLKIENYFWPFSSIQQSTFSKLKWHLKDTNNLSYDSKVLQIFNSFKPEIVFTNNLSGFSCRIWKLANQNNIKIIHTLRDYYLQCPRTSKFKNKSNCKSNCTQCRVLSISKKKLSNLVDKVVGISNFILEDHISKGFFKNASKHMIYNGFNIENYPSKQFKLLNSDELVFGYIGQLKEEKGIELMINSFTSLNEKNWQLKIAGKINSSYYDYLNRNYDLSNIVFLGFYDNKQFYKNIDVLVVPSVWNEPFGRVVLEGFLNNKVVITSRMGGICELMQNNFENTFEISKNDLRQLLIKLINNRKALKTNYSKEFLSKFDIKNTALKYKSIFEEILNNTNS